MRALVPIAFLGATLAAAADARADSKATTSPTTPTTAEKPERATSAFVDAGPNRLLLGTGITTLGFAYGIAAYVGATTERSSERWLIVPFAGPWLALANREGCAETGTTPCDVDPAFRGLLVADGLLQLAGAAQIALAFVKRERRDVTFLPSRVPGGAGLVALGTF